jgi:hypothetical protein
MLNDIAAARATLDGATELRLLSTSERELVLRTFDDAFPFRNVARLADSLHAHVKVESTADLPRAALLAMGGVVENEKDGYVKFAFASGVNLIFSSIAVSQDDLRETKDDRKPRPFLDHLGIDVRRETEASRAAFDRMPSLAAELGAPHVAQGGVGNKAVFCCHTSVAAKHWIFPCERTGIAVPIEVAFGPLTIELGKSGCDLRPSSPSKRSLLAPSDGGCCG